MPEDDDDTEVMLLRGKGARELLDSLKGGSDDDGGDDEDEDTFEDEDGRVWRSAKASDGKKPTPKKAAGKGFKYFDRK